MVKKVIFSFTDENLDNLLNIVRDGNFESSTETLALALKMLQTLQVFAKMGYSKIEVIHPTTGERREILMPHLVEVAQAASAAKTPTSQ